MIARSTCSGFTLVELSIVLIVIGLLIGGTFAGMKLVENMRLTKTAQQLKSIESASLTFKDAYGRLPGDLRSPASRLPDCTDAPCNVSGDGNRIIGPAASYGTALTAGDERFSFWHHLQASGMISLQMKRSTDLKFGEGQPRAAIGGGWRMIGWRPGAWCGPDIHRAPHTLGLMKEPDDAWSSVWYDNTSISCKYLKVIDSKIDDGQPSNGNFKANSCTPWCSLGVDYNIKGMSYGFWVLPY